MLRALVAWMAMISPVIAGDLAFVTSQNGDEVSVIDLATARILARTPLEGGPAPVAYDAARGRAYVVAARTGRLSVLDEAARPLDATDLGEGVFGVAVAPGGGVFVTDWFGGRLLRLDAALELLWSQPTGPAPSGVAVSEDGGLVATADRDANAVSIFDAVTGRRLRQVATAGEHPFALLFHDRRLWSVDVMGNRVTVIDPIAGQVLGEVVTGSHPYGIAFAGGRGFVTNQYAGTLTVFDPVSLAPIGEVATGDYPEGIAALPDGSGVVVANWESDSVQIIDAASLTVRAEVAVAAGPRAFGLFTGRQARP